MATATKTRPIEETYRNPLSLARNGLRYFLDRKSGKHVVVHEMTAGEDIGPAIYRFETIEEARVMWRKVRIRIKANGYTQRIG